MTSFSYEKLDFNVWSYIVESIITKKTFHNACICIHCETALLFLLSI